MSQMTHSGFSVHPTVLGLGLGLGLGLQLGLELGLGLGLGLGLCMCGVIPKFLSTTSQ